MMLTRSEGMMLKIAPGKWSILIILSIMLVSCNHQVEQQICREVIRTELLTGAKNPLVYFSDEGTLYVLDHTYWKVHHFDQDGEIIESFSLPQDLIIATSLSFGLQDGHFVFSYPGGIYSIGASSEIIQFELPVSETGQTVYPMNCGTNRFYLHGPISGDGRVFVCMRGINSKISIVQYDSPTDWHVLYIAEHSAIFGDSGFWSVFPGWDGYVYVQSYRGEVKKIDENGQKVSTIAGSQMIELVHGAVLIGVDHDGFLYFESGGSPEPEVPATLYKVSPDWELVWEKELPNINSGLVPGFIDSSGAYYYWYREDTVDSFLSVLVKCDY